MADGQDPERTRVMLERFYDAMASEIDAAGGTVEKFAGDAVMAAFGAPAALEDHAERALHAALAMQRRLSDLFGDSLALRIGVNTGEVVVGKPREGSSFVTGDPVNVAARLEQAAEPGQIMVGARTVAAARGAFEFGDARSIDAKGKPLGVEARLLLGALTLTRPRGVTNLQPAFVGRDEELAILERVYGDAVRDASPRLVTVLGDAGVASSGRGSGSASWAPSGASVGACLTVRGSPTGRSQKSSRRTWPSSTATTRRPSPNGSARDTCSA
jgi:hypothetical protein